MIEEVSANQRHHGGVRASSIAQVEDDGIGVVKRSQRRLELLTADRWIWKPVQLEVAEVMRKNLDILDEAMLVLDSLAELRALRNGWLGHVRRPRVLAVNHFKVHVAAHVSHLPGE